MGHQSCVFHGAASQVARGFAILTLLGSPVPERCFRMGGRIATSRARGLGAQRDSARESDHAAANDLATVHGDASAVVGADEQGPGLGVDPGADTSHVLATA